MLDWIKSLFGKGTVRVEFNGVDRDGKAQSGTAKIPYVGAYDEAEALEQFKQVMMVEHRISIRSARVIGHVKS